MKGVFLLREIKTKAEFQEQIKNGAVLVDFFATWCRPCKMLAPELEGLSVDVVKVDVDTLPNLASEQDIMGVPTLMLFKDGEMLGRTSGYMQKQDVEDWIESIST